VSARLRSLVLAVVLAGAVAANALAEPVVDKLRINFNLTPHANKPEWTWSPGVRFRLGGIVSSADTVSVEYTLPNGQRWLTTRCDTEQTTSAAESQVINGCGARIEDALSTNATGGIAFRIVLANALSGRNATLFSGRFNVGRTLYNPDKSASRNKQFYYHVDNDWRLPMAYVGVYRNETHHQFYTELWLKNRITDKSKINAYLILNGNTVAEAWASTVLSVSPPETVQQHYELFGFKFNAITDKPVSAGYNDSFKTYENPGEYEVKVLRDGKLARHFNVRVGADGKAVDTGVVRQNGLSTEGAVVPVNVLGADDGTWSRSASKTEAIWGNPIIGFSVP
jgi:hypothetical protein